MLNFIFKKNIAFGNYDLSPFSNEGLREAYAGHPMSVYVCPTLWTRGSIPYILYRYVNHLSLFPNFTWLPPIVHYWASGQ
jgi:hypothetical protein